MAMQKLMKHKGLVTGIIYQNKDRLSYEDMIKGFKAEPLAKQNIELTREQFDKLVAEFA
jgi:2-oxoglutarate ferredoxin oxidoreductase subunit beta